MSRAAGRPVGRDAVARQPNTSSTIAAAALTTASAVADGTCGRTEPRRRPGNSNRFSNRSPAGGGFIDDRHLRDKPIAPFRHRFDECRLLDVVVQPLPQLRDSARQCVRRDEGVLPDRVQKLFLRDQAVAPDDEQAQDIERLRLERHPLVAFPNAHSAQIEAKSLEFENITASRHSLTRPSRRRPSARLTVRR